MSQRGANRLRIADVVAEEDLYEDGPQGRRRCVLFLFVCTM